MLLKKISSINFAKKIKKTFKGSPKKNSFEGSQEKKFVRGNPHHAPPQRINGQPLIRCSATSIYKAVCLENIHSKDGRFQDSLDSGSDSSKTFDSDSDSNFSLSKRLDSDSTY